MAKKQTKEPVDIDLTEAYSKTERFINENQNVVTSITVAIALIIGGYFGISRLYIEPLEEEAQSQMFMAQQYFDMDSFRLALEGDGNYLGFIDIMDEYAWTKSGNLANYYAGISYLHQGDFESAIDYLDGFNCDDPVINSMALGAVGDAYMEMEESDKGIKYYGKAANHSDNEFTAPYFLLKYGMALEMNGNLEQAQEAYERIKNDYPDTQQGRDIEKYIYRVSAQI